MPVRAGDYWRVDRGFINGSAATFVVQWIPLTGGSGGSGTTAGVSAMASLTDATLTNLAGRDYLRYDPPSGKWGALLGQR